MHFLGHSTVRIELAGRIVLTDPLLLPLVGALRRVVPAPDPTPAAPTIARAEALLLEVEAILLHLDDEARIDVLVELDRLGDICKAADPIAVSRAVPRNTGANRSSVVMSSIWKVSCSQIASRHGPSPASYCSWSACSARSSLLAGVSTRRRCRTRETLA